MPLSVLSVAYPFSPVSPGTAGGAEQILGALDRALTAEGHTSLVVACEGSRTHGSLYAAATIPTDGTITSEYRIWAQRRMQSAIDEVLRNHPVNLIHMHGLDFTEYKLPAHLPVLVTLHMPIRWYGEGLLRYRHPRLHLCCVSQTQRRTCPPQLLPIHVVENGIELPQLTEEPKPLSSRDDFALVLGRICPEKNQHAALLAGSQAGISVHLAGQVFHYAEHQAYFDQQIRPLLGPQPTGLCHKFLGPVEPSTRASLLSSAQCLLHPTLAPETSSLVAMEALAAGTPVIALRSGALPEILPDPQTAILVDTPEQMAAALHQLYTLSPTRCRQYASDHFDQSQMIRSYFRRYEQIIHSSKAERYA